MESVTVSRVLDAPADAVRELVTDVGPFMLAAEFDDVTVEGSTVVIENSVGLASIELVCELIETDCVLAYEQREGIFETMETRYELTDVDGGTEISATTTFAVDVALVGAILDGTVIKRQRRKELTSQFDYLQRTLGDG